MLVIPAIDLEDGCVVRFVQGRHDKKIYSRNPVKTAKHWVKQGAKLLHIVDLDGAITGIPGNLGVLKKIARNIGVPIQFGGGVRKIETIRSLLNDYGVSRVVLGTKAVSDKAFLKKAFKEFKSKIIASIDAKQETVLTEGWRSAEKKIGVIEFAKFLKSIGFKQVIYTDTLKDGTLSGPNIRAIKALIKESGLNVIASGGVSMLEDIFKLKKLEKQGVTAVIVGKALYEGRFTLAEAIKLSEGKSYGAKRT
jgi:phosphoribosylformimino-5-aminoimidazole carboxamide ribotide isomerase